MVRQFSGKMLPGVLRQPVDAGSALTPDPIVAPLLEKSGTDQYHKFNRIHYFSFNQLIYI